MKFTTENQNIEYKGIQKIRTGDKGFRDLSITCVAFANAQGGQIYIGVDNKTLKVGDNQVISQEEQNDAVTKLRGLCFGVALSPSDIMADENGSNYFVISVFPSLKIIATTSDGKIYIRIADKCEPIRNEDIQRLAEEKGAFQWEINPTKYGWNDPQVMDNIHKFAEDMRHSPRVKDLNLQQPMNYKVVIVEKEIYLTRYTLLLFRQWAKPYLVTFTINQR